MSEHHFHYTGTDHHPLVGGVRVAGNPCHRPTYSDFKALMEKPIRERMKYCPDWLPTEECDCEAGR